VSCGVKDIKADNYHFLDFSTSTILLYFSIYGNQVNSIIFTLPPNRGTKILFSATFWSR